MRGKGAERNAKESKLWVLPGSTRAPHNIPWKRAVVGCAGNPHVRPQHNPHPWSCPSHCDSFLRPQTQWWGRVGGDEPRLLTPTIRLRPPGNKSLVKAGGGGRGPPLRRPGSRQLGGAGVPAPTVGERALRTQDFQLRGAQGPGTSFLCCVPTPAVRLLLEKLENKAGGGRGMLGAAINRGSSQEGGRGWPTGTPGSSPQRGGDGGRRRGEGPPGALTLG